MLLPETGAILKTALQYSNASMCTVSKSITVSLQCLYNTLFNILSGRTILSMLKTGTYDTLPSECGNILPILCIIYCKYLQYIYRYNTVLQKNIASICTIQLMFYITRIDGAISRNSFVTVQQDRMLNVCIDTLKQCVRLVRTGTPDEYSVYV